MPVAIGRRELIAALGSAATWPLTARAQKTPLIAWLDGGGQPRPDSVVAFRGGLNQLGYVEGDNVAIKIYDVERPEHGTVAFLAAMTAFQLALTKITAAESRINAVTASDTCSGRSTP